jgi:hypothetical protein
MRINVAVNPGRRPTWETTRELSTAIVRVDRRVTRIRGTTRRASSDSATKWATETAGSGRAAKGIRCRGNQGQAAKSKPREGSLIPFTSRTASDVFHLD